MKVFLFLQLLAISIYAQYGSFDITPSTPEKAGLAGNGIGIESREFSLYSNTAFLADKESMVSGGILVASKENSISPLLPAHFGFYKKLDSNSGWGIRGQKMYSSLFRGNEKLLHYESQIFYSYNWNSFYMSFGIGPALGFRGIEYSPVGTTGIVNLGYKQEGFTIGLGGISPGKFSYKAYRDSDPLEEKLPDILELGSSYKWESFLFYLEATRLFYEKSKFRLSDLDERPSFDRGLGAEIKVSSGLEMENLIENWKFRLGVNTGGKYDADGKNRRAMGIGLGATYYLEADKKGGFFSVGILNYSIFSRKGGREPETFFLLSGGYLW